MRLVTFVLDGESRLGVETAGSIVDLAAAWELLCAGSRSGLSTLPSEMIEFLEAGEPALAAAREVEEFVRTASSTDDGPQEASIGSVLRSTADVRISAPIPRPGKIICLGRNYADHAAETGAALPAVPILFAKFANAIVGPGDPIILPRASAQVDYEAEMAFVVGRRARNVPLAQAYDYVAGYTMLNDVSARDLQFETGQWLPGKCPDTFAPTGPYLVTRDEVPDPQTLDIKLWLNGQLMQSSNTRHLIFNVPFLVHYISRTVTLEPGDIVSTGTPGGVGFTRKPPVFLMAGDVVRVEVAGLGVLENPVVAEE